KEEELVLEYRASDVSAKPAVIKARMRIRIAYAGAPRDALRYLLGVERVQMPVQDEAIGRPVKRIRSAFGHRDELPARPPREFGLILIRQERELGYVFRRDIDLRSRYRLVIVIHAIYHEVVVARALAAN